MAFFDFLEILDFLVEPFSSRRRSLVDTKEQGQHGVGSGFDEVSGFGQFTEQSGVL